jgi:hypothetical protein
MARRTFLAIESYSIPLLIIGPSKRAMLREPSAIGDAAYRWTKSTSPA